MSDLRDAARQALTLLELVSQAATKQVGVPLEIVDTLRAALEQPERTLTDEVIADLWHQNGGFHHHFARAVERYLKGEK
jgi:hypothetical protein